MTDQSSPLPSFAKPPVNEVVLSVAFDRPAGFTIAHVGDFWRRYLRDEFPELEEQAPYVPPVEVLGPPTPAVMNIQIGRVPSPRLWAKSSDGSSLVQLQPDWLAFNWRDAPEVDYPRWPTVEHGFLEQLRRLATYFDEEGFGAVVARQCEVTYVNQLKPGGVWTSHADLDRVFSLIGTTAGFLPSPETLQFSVAYRVKSNPTDTEDRGRLHVTVQPAFQREDNQPVIALTLLARGAPRTTDGTGVVEFLRLGHEWIVRGFADLTTAAMHDEWERLT